MDLCSILLYPASSTNTKQPTTTTTQSLKPKKTTMRFGRSNNASTKQTNDNKAAPKGVPVYLKSAEHGWIPALQLKTYHGKAKVAVPRIVQENDLLHCSDSSQKLRFDNHEIDLADYKDGMLPMQNVDHHGNVEDYKDMVDLPFMHEVRGQRQHNNSYGFDRHRVCSFCYSLRSFFSLFFCHRPRFCTI
jgi:hypothetical protein